MQVQKLDKKLQVLKDTNDAVLENSQVQRDAFSKMEKAEARFIKRISSLKQQVQQSCIRVGFMDEWLFM